MRLEKQITVVRCPWNGSVDLRYGESAGGNKWSAATNLIMATVEDGERVPAFLTLDRDVAQQLIDGLYACGFRPSGEVESVGHLAAVKYHLEDMRTLAFHALGKLQKPSEKFVWPNGPKA
jgi:hypothetical protein